MRTRTFMAALTLMPALAFLPPEALSAADEVSVADQMTANIEPASYWRRQRDGWFWYREPPIEKPPADKTVPDRPRELIEFEAMQGRLDELKRIAVMNPSDANLLAYMQYQQQIMRRAEVFAQGWQRLVWITPELDYGLRGRPTNTTASVVYDGELQQRQGRAIRALAADHQLLFIFRSDCPYCHRFAPILKRFEETFGLRVFAVSLDGQGLPEYPAPQADNGIAARLNASVVPALYLTAPATRDIQPVGFGLMAVTDLIERIAALASPGDAPQ